jgi:uncharacterized protein
LVACLSSLPSRGRVAKDLPRAGTLFKRACDGGNSNGCFVLGAMYANGRGVAKDLPRAATLYKQACDAGMAAGCSELRTLRGAP